MARLSRNGLFINDDTLFHLVTSITKPDVLSVSVFGSIHKQCTVEQWSSSHVFRDAG